MAAKRLSDEQWAEARIRWESDPELTMEALAKEMGVNKATVGRAALRRGWAKAGCQPTAAPKKTDPVSETRFLENREKLKAIHRDEWRKHAAEFSIQNLTLGDFDNCKKGKIITEIIANRQAGERKAWGLDEPAGAGDRAVIIEWAD